MLEAKGVIVSILHLYQPIERIETLIGFVARTKAASVKVCGERADETCSTRCSRSKAPALRENLA